MKNKKIDLILDKQKDHILKMRREFHRYPEKSWEEYRTSRRIKEELSEIGIDYKEYAETGVVGIIDGNGKGATVALRADIDALEVEEKNEVEYKSQNEGIMHACGHDGHTAILLGTARALHEMKDEFSGKVKLIFQPAEEKVQGAIEMVEAGVIDDVDGIMGIHLWNGIPTGKINVQPGPRMASSDSVKIDFYGKGGHGSLPQQTVDPIVMASSFIMESQAILSRESDPLDPVVFTLGQVKSGTRFNIIPEKAHLEGTLRCFNQETRENSIAAIERYAQKIASSYRGRVEVDIKKGTPPTINEESCTEIGKNTAEGIVGPDNLVQMKKTTGSEDMAYYLQKVPGLIAFVGAGFAEDDKNFPHHHPKFDLNEDSLNIGLNLYVKFALDFLNQ